MKTIFIATSNFDSAITLYFRQLGFFFYERKYKVVFILDGQLKDLPGNKENLLFFTWPNKRPTKIADILFLFRLIRKYNPRICLSNFGSTNVMTLVSYILGVKRRVNYIHTTTVQLDVDSGSRFRNRLLRTRKKFVYKLCTHLFTNSNGTKDNTIDIYKIPPNKISVFPYLLRSSPRKYKTIQERENSLIIVGRLHSSKGHELLLNQFASCLESFPELRLKIIGDGPLLQSLKRKAMELGISKQVELMGRVTNKLIGREFSVVLASISSSIDEAFGLVNVEALREGTPLLCTKTAGSRDIINEGVNGLFYKNDEPDSLLKSLNQIMENWDRYSKNALCSFQTKYDMCRNSESQFMDMENILS